MAGTKQPEEPHRGTDTAETCLSAGGRMHLLGTAAPLSVDVEFIMRLFAVIDIQSRAESRESCLCLRRQASEGQWISVWVFTAGI